MRNRVFGGQPSRATGILLRFARRRHRHNVVGLGLAGKDAFKMTGPGFEGVPLLGVVRVAIIDAGDLAVGMVQNLADHQPGDAHGGHQTGAGPPQIVRSKVGEADPLQILGKPVVDAPAVDRFALDPWRREQPFRVVAEVADAAEQFQGQVRERYGMRLAVLSALAAYGPEPVR